MFYTGAGTYAQIGRATAAAHDGTWTRYGGNPILTLGGAGAFDEEGVSYPVVLHEPADTGKEWKLWYSGVKASDGKVRIGYAYSSDGLSWTKVGQVLDVGAGGQWDDDTVGPATITKTGATYSLFYHGWHGQQKQAGIATFTDPEGAYTRYGSNPVLLARYHDSPAPSETLTAPTGAGTATVTLADSSAYNVGEPVALGDTGVETEIHEVASTPTGTTVTLNSNTTSAFGIGGVLRSFAYQSVGCRSILSIGGQFVLFGSPFQPVEDLAVGGSKLREGSIRWTASALTGPWSYDYTAGLLLPLYPATTGWHKFSAENLSVIAAP